MTGQRIHVEVSTSWWAEAACRPDGGSGLTLAVFVPDSAGTGSEGKIPAAVVECCAGCAVREACLGWALEHDEVGFWAGTTSKARRLMLSSNRSRVRVCEWSECRAVFEATAAGQRYCDDGCYGAAKLARNRRRQRRNRASGMIA